MDSRRINFRNANGFPPTICIQLLKWCNLKCTFCRADSSPRETEELNLTSLVKILANLKSYGNWRISLTGGEPFYWKSLASLLKTINDLNFPFSITTNGFGSKQIFDTIPPNIWNNGTLYVSIDGTKDIHNKLRGENSYEKAIEFLLYVKPKVPRLHVNTVLFTHPKLWADELYLALTRVGISNWTIISPVQSGRWNNLIAVDKDFVSQYEYIKTIAANYGNITSTSFLNFSETENKIADVVFIDSNGMIKLPGYYHPSSEAKPKLGFIELTDPYAARKVFNAVNTFLLSEKYML